MNKVSPPGTPAGADWFTNVMFVASSGGDVTGGTYAAQTRGRRHVHLQLGRRNGHHRRHHRVQLRFRATTAPSPCQRVVLLLPHSQSPDKRHRHPRRDEDFRAPRVSATRASQSPAVPRTNDTVTVNIALGACQIAGRTHLRALDDEQFCEPRRSWRLPGQAQAIPRRSRPCQPGVTYVYYILSSTVTPGGGLNGEQRRRLDAESGRQRRQ